MNLETQPFDVVENQGIDSIEKLEMNTNDRTWYHLSGRIGRLRFISYEVAIFLLYSIVLLIIAGTTPEKYVQYGNIHQGVFALLMGVTLPFLYYGCIVYPSRRLNDLNMTGWASLLIFIPVVNLVFIFIRGTKGANKYGYPPRPNLIKHYMGLIIFICLFLFLFLQIC